MTIVDVKIPRINNFTLEMRWRFNKNRSVLEQGNFSLNLTDQLDNYDTIFASKLDDKKIKLLSQNVSIFIGGENDINPIDWGLTLFRLGIKLFMKCSWLLFTFQLNCQGKTVLYQV